METFCAKVADVLETPAVTPDFDFRTVPDWDSLKGFGLIVLVEQTRGRAMTVDEFLACRTVTDLARACGI